MPLVLHSDYPSHEPGSGVPWAKGPAHPCLPPGELHVWRTRLHEATPLSTPADALCPVDREGARRITAGCFHREIMGRYTGLSGWDGNFQPLAPHFIPGLRVSLARCDDLALLAISRDVRQLGLDVERVREDIPFDDMAASFLDLRAQWDLRITWSRQEKAWKFFQFWTSNEACAQLQTSSTHAEPLPWRLHKFSPGRNFVAALAVHGGPEPHVHFWDCQP